jgi:DNA-binding transcriptional ArsR family regulator
MRIDPDMLTSDVLARSLRLAAHPLRLRILSELVRHPRRCVCDLAADLSVEQPVVSHHLGALRTAGLVLPRREGARVEYEIEPRGASALLVSLGAVLGNGPRGQGVRR